MASRLSITVPDPEDVDIDVTPTRLVVTGAYRDKRHSVQIDYLQGQWWVSGVNDMFTGRDEATEAAVAYLCNRIRSAALYEAVEAKL